MRESLDQIHIQIIHLFPTHSEGSKINSNLSIWPQTKMPSKDSKEEKKEKAREVVDILEEISLLLVSSCVLLFASSNG